MQGYIYLDNDSNLNFRNKEYIEVEDPGFWSRNSHFVDTVWKFDTEDDTSMFKLLSSLKRHELPNKKVIDLCKAIQFDLPSFLKKQAPSGIP